ncbi:MAG: hypothetical protein JWP28_3277 [Phenylobacterium sp.]|uniref:hypothetical protein n=1 Tax=Phenylobacterium sp. TaxID=1871053 RepID=UPI0026169AD0|nr:hypothetical protein [Phenylobacterium sp.]MDB5499246.1 hypothetical protein [Phenylobacterium sp.]
MLADDPRLLRATGRLAPELRLAEAWRASLVEFIAEALPVWRDDPSRPPATAETELTSQLCGFLNSATRHSRGWDYLQFRVEEPDETKKGRAIDLIAAPSGVRVWIDGALFPIECKRMPTPTGPSRDEREYLHSRHGSRGGVQRFKAGAHGAAHRNAGMIAYVQTDGIEAWRQRISQWILDLIATLPDWSSADMIQLQRHDLGKRLAVLGSQHPRANDLVPLAVDHLWIEM